MGEFRDRRWDAKYENFLRLKKQRISSESTESTTPRKTSSESEVTKNEGRKFVNKGPSRYLREHVEKTQRDNTQQSKAQQTTDQSQSEITVVKQEPIYQEIKVVKEEYNQTGRSTFMDLLPYLFIAFGIIILILILTNII